MSSRSKQYDRFTGFIVKDSTPRANKISRTSSLTSLARIWSVRRSAPLAFFVTVSSSPAFASSSSRSRDSIVPSASSKTSGLGTTNMHRCMPETTAHADTVSPSTLDASTGTRPKRNTVPGCAMSSCASRKKKGSVESESSGREPSASCAGAASTATSSPAASSHTAAHPSAAPSSVDAAATAAPDAVTPAAGGAGARTVVSLRIPVFLAIAAAAAGLGGSSSSSSSSSSIGTGADASSASMASPSSRWLECTGDSGGLSEYSSAAAPAWVSSAQVTARGVGLAAGADAALGAVGVTMDGFMSVAGVACTLGGGAVWGAGRLNALAGLASGGAGIPTDVPMSPRMSSRSESASCAGLAPAASAMGARLRPPAATAAAFFANMLARRCLSRLSTSGFLRLASLPSAPSLFAPFLRFLPSAASASSSSSSDIPGCALVQSSSSPRST